MIAYAISLPLSDLLHSLQLPSHVPLPPTTYVPQATTLHLLFALCLLSLGTLYSEIRNANSDLFPDLWMHVLNTYLQI